MPVVPGTEEALTSSEQAVAFAKEAGLPVILKAAMGGGGRGMRVVHNSATCYCRRVSNCLEYAHALPIKIARPVHASGAKHHNADIPADAVDELEAQFKRASNEALAAFG